MKNDLIDRHVTIVEGPDVRNYQETARITQVRFAQDNFYVRHTKEGKRQDSWPGIVPPGWEGPVQWTLWVIVSSSQAGWVTAGCLEYWPEETPTMGSNKGGPAPFSDARRNWWYSMPIMSKVQPGPDDEIGIFVTQGSQRKKDIKDVNERSNVVWVRVPPNDTGEYNFPGEVPQPQPEPEPGPEPPSPPQPTPTPTDLSLVLEKIEKILQRLEELAPDHYKATGQTAFGRVTLEIVKK